MRLKQSNILYKHIKIVSKQLLYPLLVIAAVLLLDLRQCAGRRKYSRGRCSRRRTANRGRAGRRTAGADAAEQTPQVDIYVDICGEVVRPGVYQIASGTRLFEVIAQAGGLTAEADINVINQAEVV